MDLSIFSYPFMQNAILAAFLGGVACATVGVFVVLWGIGYAVSRPFMIGSFLFTSYVAVLDVVLVLLVFKGDVRVR